MGSSKYKNITKIKLIRALKKLQRDFPHLGIEKATKHTHKLSYPFAKRSYPLAFNHVEIHEFVVEGVKDWLIENEVCSEEDFDKALKILV